jgi:hypothetical protein
MSQVNVNTPGEPEGSSGSGFIIGVVLAVLVIAALVYFFVLGGNNGGDGGNGADGGNGGTESQGDMIESVAPEPSAAAPSAWVLVDHLA